MQITVLSVSIETRANKNGGSFQIADVAYKDDSGKVAGKKVMSFGATEKAFKVLAENPVGKTFDVEQVKGIPGPDGKSYWNWTGLSQSTGKQAVSPVAEASKTVKSTYETAEERAKKQVYIIKQSSLANAINTLSVGAKAAPKAEDIIALAQTFTDWVFAEKQTALTDLPNDLDFQDDVPY